MSLLTPPRSPKPAINIVPLVDVLIVLIFFILMTMQFRNLSTLNITPPKMETAGPNKATDDISIGINPEGGFFYNNRVVTKEELESSLLNASKINKHQSVLVLADEETAVKHMTTVMDASRKAGLEKVRLQVR